MHKIRQTVVRNMEYEVTTGDKTLIFSAELSDTQKEVLNLLELLVAAYR